MFPHSQPRPGLVPFRPPVEEHNCGCSPECAIDIDFSMEDEKIDVWFRDYILNDPGVQPRYFYVTQFDVNNFVKALEAAQKDNDTEFKVGDYIIVTNAEKSKYAVYLRTTDDWITFTGKSAYDVEPGDVDIIIDDDDDITFEDDDEDNSSSAPSKPVIKGQEDLILDFDDEDD